MELIHESSPEHLRIGTARLKSERETEEDGKRKRAKMERSKVGAKKINPDGLTIARAYRPQGSILPQEVDELHNGTKTKKRMKNISREE